MCLSTAAPKLLVKRLSAHARLPVRGSAEAAGYDLCSAEDCVVPAKGKYVVKTDLSLAIPLGTYGRIAPRSGLASKKFIDTGAGVIDSDYRGPLGVLLFNFNDEDFSIKQGDRIAQLILERIMTPAVEEVESLDVTLRGEGGFGSTGVSENIAPISESAEVIVVATKKISTTLTTAQVTSEANIVPAKRPRIALEDTSATTQAE
jgi:dUTP pyrophosphatase